MTRALFAIALWWRSLFARRSLKRAEPIATPVVCRYHGTPMIRAGYGDWFCGTCYREVCDGQFHPRQHLGRGRRL